MIIGIVIGIILIIIITLIVMLKSSDEQKKTESKNNVKVLPITKGRSYPWFYIKECLFYFPISTTSVYENETKQALIDELLEMQKLGDFEKVIEICEQIIAKDYKFSRAWIDKINAIFNAALAGKEWKASTSKNILNCCYNYLRAFDNNYDKSINAKHSLIPAVLKRAQDMINYNRETKSETYNFEIYNLLINLHYLMPFNEIIDKIITNLESGKKLAEISQNQYAVDAMKSLLSHTMMLKEKHSIDVEVETVEEIKITNKAIVNDETFSSTWIGFNIQFPSKVDRVELVFKFYDNRRQEIDLSGGSNRRMVELFKQNSANEGYDVVVLGEDGIRFVTVEVYDESKRFATVVSEILNEETENTNDSEQDNKNNLEAQRVEFDNEIKQVESRLKEKLTKVEERKETKPEEKQETVIQDVVEEEKEETQEVIEEEMEKIEYKVYPAFSSIKQIAMSENYVLFLTEENKVKILGNIDKNIDTSTWDNIESIYATPYAAYGIRKDGTITVAGKSVYDSWEYQYTWENIQKLIPSYNHIVGLKKDGTVVASGHEAATECEVNDWTDIVDISASFHTVGLTKEGKVVAAGANKFGECDVSNWTNIVKVVTGPFFTVGLRDNGTVVAAGLNSCGQCNTREWKDVKEIYARGNVTVGLKYDGTVLVTGRNSYRFEDAKKWHDIKDIKIVSDRIIGITTDGKINYIGKPYWGRIKEEWSNVCCIEANSSCILGQKEDGTLVCNKPLFGLYLPNDYENFLDIEQNEEADKVVVLGKDGKIDVYAINNFDLYKWDTSKFNNVKQISLSKTHLAGLKYDGTAVITGDDISLCFEVERWKNLVKVAVGEKFVLGLTIDGRVVATGNNFYGQCDVESWLDVIDIAVYGSKAIGLKSDGTVLITGYLEFDEETFINDAKNIVGIAINSKQIMLLDGNGNVSLSYNPFGEDKKNVLEWRNIIKIQGNKDSFIGLKADKTLITTGDEDITEWKNITNIKASGAYIIGISKTKQD